MGGDAFPNTSRLTEREYRDICEAIANILNKMEVEFGFPVEVLDKAELCAARGKDRWVEKALTLLFSKLVCTTGLMAFIVSDLVNAVV